MIPRLYLVQLHVCASVVVECSYIEHVQSNEIHVWIGREKFLMWLAWLYLHGCVSVSRAVSSSHSMVIPM